MAKEPTAKLLPLKLKQHSKERKLPLDYLVKTWGLRDVDRVVACIEQPYTRMDGTVGAPRYRYANKKLSPTDSGDRIFLYGQKQFLSPRYEGIFSERYEGPGGEGVIFLVEGESDTQTLHFCGLPVLGIPGTSMWDTCLANDPDIATFLTSKTLLVIQEPPSVKEKAKGLNSPEKMIARIKASLPLCIVIPVKLWEFAPKDENGDPLYEDVSGLFTYHGGDFRKFENALDIAIRASGGKELGAWRLNFVWDDAVEAKVMEWLWRNRIPLGNLTVFFGLPGQGKSLSCADLIARGTTGRAYPDIENELPPWKAAVLATEDDLETIWKPRLMVAGYKPGTVAFLQGLVNDDATTEERHFALGRDTKMLEAFLEEHPEIKLVVVDPLTSYTGDANPMKDEEVRPLLEGLVSMAARAKVAIVGICHLNKTVGLAGIQRMGGAGAWSAVPRLAWAFVAEPEEEDEEPRDVNLMVNGKPNVTADKSALAFKTESVQHPVSADPKDTVPRMVWLEGKVNISLNTAMAPKPRGMKPVKTEAALKWLLKHLADGDVPSVKLFEAGEAAGHKPDTLFTTKSRSEGRVIVRPGGKPFMWGLKKEPVGEGVV